jgi:adenylate cyclase
MRKPPESLDAWAAYQRGLWHLSKYNPEDDTLAQPFLQQAIDLDPNFAGGYTALAIVRRRMAFRRGLPELEDSTAWARRAVALDGNDAEARASLAFCLMQQGDRQGALVEVEAALATSPNLASAHGVLGSLLNWSNRRREARASLEKSIRLDPRSPELAIRYLALTINFYLSGEYDAAVDAARRVIRSFPDVSNAYRWLAAALGQLGRSAEAKEALDKAIEMAPAQFEYHAQRRAVWHRPEDDDHMLEGLRKAGWKE